MLPRPHPRSPSPAAALLSALLLLTVGLAHAPALAQQPGLPREVTVTPPFVGAPVYDEDFQDGPGGWVADTPPAPAMTWEHGVPASGPGHAVSGERVWATNLDGDHRPYECGVLLSPPIDLSQATTAQVQFQHWYHFHQGSWSGDGGALLVTTDGGTTFEQVTPLEGYDAQMPSAVRACLGLADFASGFTGGSDGYRTATVDLDGHTGQTLRFALGFASGDSREVRPGWYLDDFALTVDGQTSVHDFEQDDGGFGYTDFHQPEQPVGWEWGHTTVASGPSFQEPTSLWGVNLDGNHGKNECSTIESPPIDLGSSLATAPQAILVWDHWLQSSRASGGGVVQVGHDGTYTNLVPPGGYPGDPYQALDDCLQHRAQGTGAFAGMLHGNGDPMTTQRADLSPWIGQEVTVRFVFATTDGIFQVDGWYVNNVRIETGVGADPITVDLPGPGDAAVQHFASLTTVYDEDFEEDDGGWQVVGTPTWEWGTPVYPPEVPPGSLHMWGTDLMGNADQQQCSYLESPAVQLPSLATPGAETVQLTLDTYRDLADEVDGAAVFVAGEDGQWSLVEPRDGYDEPLWYVAQLACLGSPIGHPVWTGPAPNASAWSTDAFDLSSFAGENVRLRIAFASGYDADHRGIYLDRATISVGAGATVAPPDPTDPQAVLASTCQDESPGWEVQDASATWCRGVPTTGPPVLQPVWATDPHGDHALGECSLLVSAPIDTTQVPGLGVLQLTIDHFMDTRYRAGGNVQVSDDGGETWRTVKPDGGYPSTTSNDLTVGCLDPGSNRVPLFRGASMEGYEEVTFNLRKYGGDTIQVRFAFAGMDLTEPGWYIRETTLDRGLAPVPIDLLANVPAPAAVPTKAAGADLSAVADPALLRSIAQDPLAHHRVIVTGPPLEPLPPDSGHDRAAAMVGLKQAAAPFVTQVEGVVEALGGEVLDAWPAAPAVGLRAPLQTLQALADLEETQHVALDGEGSVELIEPIPSDHDGLRALNSEGRQMIGAEAVWELGYTGEGMRISVIDTGIDGRHEAFKTASGESRIVGWIDLYGGQPEPYDDHGHGTHVAATAAGSSAYDDPVHGTFQETGVAPGAELLGVKFLSGGGSGRLSDALDALEWSFENGANVTSNSWGSNCASATAIISTVRQLTDLGMPSVFAAGNSGPAAGTIGGPACGEESITVGAVDADGVVAGFSSRGPCTDPTLPDAEPRVCPDVVAKGEDVRSAVPRDGAVGASPGGYRTWSGTSMATPHVAGAVALIEQMKVDLTGTGWDTEARAEEAILKQTALPLPTIDAGPNDDYGDGLVQADSIYHVLTSEGEANVVDRFGVGADELRIGDRTDYHFTVRNHGMVPAAGTLHVSLTHPDGTVEVLADQTVSLGLLEMAGVEETFSVGGGVVPGPYQLDASFDYTWQDPGTGATHQERIEHHAMFTVVRPYLDLSMDGLAHVAPPVLPQEVTYAATNIGNEGAAGVELRWTVPDGYEFLPPEGADPTDPPSTYTSPPPSRVHEGATGRTLVYKVGSLEVGETVAIHGTLVATEVGDHRFLGVGVLTDTVGNSIAQGVIEHQQVATPLGLAPAVS